MNSLLELIKYGQSYWLDNLTRGMIAGGNLRHRVTEQGLRGVTSNPAIFHKAIAGSDDYDAHIEELVHAGLEIHDIYERLVVADVQDACDILRPVYDASEGVDGFVSLEVSPYLAHDTTATMREARRLFAAVNRPNVFIKIPGTPAGVPAIEAMLYEGVNINITLLFAIKDYEAVAQAYLRAMERRVAEDKPIHHVASVASFFLSRIDVLVDQLLGHRVQPQESSGEALRPEQLFGKVAIASAKLAYQRFKQLFSGERWQALEAKGARVQRPLWASTSTKNPLYPDVYYVEPLVGPNTVNTMPDATIDAFGDHGVIVENAIAANADEAPRLLRQLEQVGIDLDHVTQQLQDEGVQKFIDPFDALMQTLAEKRQKILGKAIGAQKIAGGKTAAALKAVAASLDERQFGRRLFAHDPFLWTADTEPAALIRQRLGWLDSIDVFHDRVDEIRRFASEVKDAGITRVVLLGMGGSSLCPEVCRDTFGSAPGWPELTVLDSTDPAAVREVTARVDAARTLFIVASKSGTTTETISLYRHFREQVSPHVAERVGSCFVAITDAGTPLAEEARKHSFRRCFENPADIGGRYSALSYFGLVPMALLGIDIAAVLERARQMRVSCGPMVPAYTNPGASLGALLGLAAQQGRDKVTFVLDDTLKAFGSWVEQLLAESTGKSGRGLVPIAGEPLGAPEVYRDDRLFVSVRHAGAADAAVDKRLTALEEAGHPVVRIAVPDVLGLGAEFFRWEVATATAGAVLGVNAFDEPNVAESKQNTKKVLEQWQQQGAFEAARPMAKGHGIALYGDKDQPWLVQGTGDSVRDLLQSFVGLAQAPHYLALLPYFRRTPERHERLQALRRKLRDRLHVATMLGYGPRYLHSTGQLHKGGPQTGIFLIFTAETPQDVPIPEASYGFATLLHAQALGDFQALNDRVPRVLRVHLGGDIEAGLDEVSACLW
jgi:transaldolase/glucose-6-phosphate isomerase